MGKRHKTYRAPAGALEPLRNTRLYGDRDVQIEGAALRSRGCPDPAHGYAGTRSRRELRVERELAAHVANLQRAQSRMLEAQRETRRARRAGQPFAALAEVARAARAEYLRLTGGVERRAMVVSQGSDTNPVKAV